MSVRTVSSKHCATMLEPLREPKRIELHRPDRAERRRRSLRKGIARWYADTFARVRARPRVALIALTFTDPDPASARGAIRAFWQAFRHAYGYRPYFSWAELQVRGAVHYHALVVNPPWRLERHARAFFREHWPHSAMQPDYQLRDYDWFVRDQGRYARKYAKKPAGEPERAPGTPYRDKSYQQRYEELPREIRTWECSRLGARVADIDRHRDRCVLVNRMWYAPWQVRRFHYEVLGWERHVTPRGGFCTLRENQRPLRRSTRSGRDWRNAGGTSTRAPRAP